MIRCGIWYAPPSERGGVGKRVQALLYARVSTDMQVEGGKSIATQLAEMREYAQHRGWEVIAEFVDPGYSGTTMERPGLQALLAAIEHHAGDVVLVHDLSRLSRRLFDTFALFETFGQHRIGFASVNDPDFDFASPTSRLFLTLIAALNQYYVDLLKMHTKKSKRERAREGLYNASIAPYGYQHTGDADTPPVIVAEEEVVVQHIFERYATGKYSYLDIADWLTDAGYRTRAGRNFSKDTLADMLRNPFYKGIISYRQGQHGQDSGEEFPGKHTPIINKELWEMCRQIREQRRSEPRTYQPAYRVYLLNGLVTCDVCGRKLRAQGSRTGNYYREVSNWRGFTDCPCAGRGALMERVDAQVAAIFRQLELPEDWQTELQTLLEEDEDVETLNHRRARLIEERKRLKRMQVKGEFEEDLEVYSQEMARIARQLAELPAPGDLEGLENAAQMLSQLSAVWDEATLIERRDLLRIALREVKVDVPQARLVTLEPYPIFVPLFRRIPFLREIAFGVFSPHWPPEISHTFTHIDTLPVLKVIPQPEHAPVWPFVPRFPPKLLGKRITPILSQWLKARRAAQLPFDAVVELSHPHMPSLRTGPRKWPEVQLRQVQHWQDLPQHAAAFLWTPFAVQAVADLPSLLAAVRDSVITGGTWACVDWLPHAMPGHWLYHYFPEAWEMTCQHAWDASRLYNLILQAGFTVKLVRRTFYQAVTLEVAYWCAQQREHIATLARLPDQVYVARLETLAEAVERDGPQMLVGSEYCLMDITAQRG